MLARLVCVLIALNSHLIGGTGYDYNPFVSERLWQELEPYFLPSKHPIKKKLDALFKKRRATLDLESFEKAGFRAKVRSPQNIVVGKHRRFPGYVFKVYFDSQIHSSDWENWVKRIEGARSIKACIKQHQFKGFEVPKKWIYPLPLDPSPPDDERYKRKNFILIVEDMNILKSKKNYAAYKNKLDEEKLFKLYIILTDVGLFDSIYPMNTPFTKRGTMAFVDTEHHHGYPVPYHKLTRFLSPPMQAYWNDLTLPSQ